MDEKKTDGPQNPGIGNERYMLAMGMVCEMFVLPPQVIPMTRSNGGRRMFSIAWRQVFVDLEAQDLEYGYRFLESDNFELTDLPRMIDEWITNPEDMDKKEDVEYVLFASYVIGHAQEHEIEVVDNMVFFRSDATAVRLVHDAVRECRELATKMIVDSTAKREPSTFAN